MKQAKTTLAMILLITLSAVLAADYSDEFVLGALKVVDMAQALDADSLDLILDDHIFVPGEQHGYSALSSGIRQIFEAEFSSVEEVNANDQNDDRFFYKSGGRAGSFVYHLDYSNWSCWQIPPDTVGYAYYDLLHRWPGNDGEFYRIGPEFRFLRSREYCGNPVGTDDNCLYVKFAFKVIDLDKLAGNDTLATFRFTSFEDPFTVVLDEANYPNALNVPEADEPEHKTVWFRFGDDSAFSPEKSLTKAEYESLPNVVGHNDPDVKEICFSFPLELPGSPNPDYSLAGQEVVKATGWYWQLKNLNPRMWWHGNGGLMLDYVEFSDKIHNEYTDNTAELARLRDYTHAANRSRHYGIDEPKPPHNQAFKKLDE